MTGPVRDRGRFVIRIGRPICDDPSQISRDDHGAAATAELRILRQGFAAISDGSAHLFLRMHVLRRLRRDQAAQCLPELRRRLCPKADPSLKGMAPRCFGWKTSAVGQARAFIVQSRRHRRAFGADQRYPTGATLMRAGCIALHRHCEQSEAIHLSCVTERRWIASSQVLLAMTGGVIPPAQSCPRLRQSPLDSPRPGTSRGS